MSDVQKTKLGDAIFGSIDDNDFLNVLYDNMLYNYLCVQIWECHHVGRGFYEYYDCLRPKQAAE